MSNVIDSQSRVMSALIAIGGPLALGATLGVPLGMKKMLADSVMLPALVLGLTVMMAPALYIGMTLVGAAPPASRVGAGVVRALRASGVVMAGLAPALAFLLSTTLSNIPMYVFGALAVGGATLAGLHALWSELVTAPEHRLRAIPVFGLWALVSLGLGAHLFIGMLQA